MTLGVRSEQVRGWKWDLSTTYGGDDDKLSVDDDANLTLFATTGATLTRFDLGGLKNTQWTTNLDVSRPLQFLLADPLNLSFGVEERRETYHITASSEQSWAADAITGLLPSSASSFVRKMKFAGPTTYS